MTFDAHMRSLLGRTGGPLHRVTRCPPAQQAAFLRATLVLCLVLGVSSACKNSVPVDGTSGVTDDHSGGSAGAITVSPVEDQHIGPLNDFDPACLRRTYVLGNDTKASLSWEVRVSKPWLSVAGSPRGILAASASVEVLVDVDPHKASLDEVEPAVAEVDFLESGTRTLLRKCTVTIESSFASTGSDGWTTFAPSADTRTVFVSSSSGNDANNGLSPATPKRTIAAGQSLLRHGFPDWLLLNRGDEWDESLGQWTKSGRDIAEPMLVSTYGTGTERPLLRTGSSAGIRTHGGNGSPSTIDSLAIVGLHFQANGYTGGGDCVGAQLLQPSSHMLIEDCKFEGYGNNLVFQGFGGRHTDFRLRRSVVIDAYNTHSTGEHSQGLYAYGVDGLLIEENVFDHNGWNETVPGAGADIFSHNLYIDNGNTDVLVRGNLIANGSSHGLQLRCGGSVVNNLFVRNSISCLVGGGSNPEPGGVTAEVLGNVILEGKDINAANPRGWGLVLSNLSSGRVAYNVVANNDLGSQPVAMILDGDAMGDNGPGIGVHDTTIVDNVFYNWGGGIRVDGDTAQITNVGFISNDLQNAVLPDPLLEHAVASTTAAFHSGQNRFFNQLGSSAAWTQIGNAPHSIAYWKAQVGDTSSVAQKVNYHAPDRSLSDYNAFLGGTPSLNAFLGEARQQSFSHWRATYTAARANRYFRAGF